MPPSPDKSTSDAVDTTGEIETGTIGRACDACHRKKTKCDMQQPVCGLCSRTSTACHFPSTRKRPSRPQTSATAKVQKLEDETQISKLNRSLTTGSDDSNDEIWKDYIAMGAVIPSRIHDVTEMPSPGGLSRVMNDRRKDVTNNIAFTRDSSADGSKQSILIPRELALHLLNVFFDKIHSWIGIFHKPTFLDYANDVLAHDGDSLRSVPCHEAMRFCATFALAARFSNHKSLTQLPARDRGEVFMNRAEKLLDAAQDLEDLTLTCIQACVLLAIYHYGAGSGKKSWPLSLICVRGCYDLGLHRVDETSEDGNTHTSDYGNWIEQELLRRTFWAVWEIDTSISSMKRKPFSIDWRHIRIKLPVSDAAWFAGTQIDSPHFIHGPDCWKALIGSPNQDERAWLLVAKSLTGYAADLALLEKGLSADQRSTTENSISCFKLAMPEIFQLDSCAHLEADMSPSRKNFVISTNIVLSTAALITSNIPLNNKPGKTTSRPEHVTVYHNRVVGLSEILRRWPPEYMAYANPANACATLTYDESLLKNLPNSAFVNSYRDLCRLVLTRFAEKWTVGAVLLRLVDIAHNFHFSNDETKAELVAQYPMYFDRTTRDRHKKCIKVPPRRVSSNSGTKLDGSNSSSTGTNVISSSTTSSHQSSPAYISASSSQHLSPLNTSTSVSVQSDLSDMMSFNPSTLQSAMDPAMNSMMMMQGFDPMSVAPNPTSLVDQGQSLTDDLGCGTDDIFNGILPEPSWQDLSFLNYLV